MLCNEVKLENRTSESMEKYDRDITIDERINQFDQTKVTLTTGGHANYTTKIYLCKIITLMPSKSKVKLLS